VDVFKIVKSLDLPLNKYLVFAGAAMVGYGIVKDTNDIDMCVTEDLYEQLKKEGWKEKTESDGLKTLHKNGVEAAIKWGYGKYDISVKALISSSKVIDGVRFIGLKELLDYKKTTNRDLDKKDAQLIEKFLKDRSS
jgi:hypothetical protein